MASQHQTPTDIIFVVEGTALNGVYLHELKQHYIIPALEQFAGPIDEKDCGSDSNYCLFGLVVFHAADILPGFVAEAYGPLTTSYQLLSQLDRLQFGGGHGEAAAHVGEGLATAMQCLQDISKFRNSAPDAPEPKKHIILVCNCKPYGLPVMESVGIDGSFKGQTAEQIANGMTEKDVHLSIIAPRKIPALITLFDRAGGDIPVQKGYARDPRHLVLLNGFQLQVVQVQERPSTPQIAKAPEIPIPPVPVSAPPVQIPVSVPHTSAPAPSPIPITRAASPAVAASPSLPQVTSAPQLQPAATSLPQVRPQAQAPSPFSQPPQQGPHVPGLSPAVAASTSGPPVPAPAPTTLVQSLQQTIPSLPMAQQTGPPQPTQVPQAQPVQQQTPPTQIPTQMPFRNPRPIAARSVLSQQAANQQIANQLAQQQLNQQQLKQAQMQAMQQQQQQQQQGQVQQPVGVGGPGQGQQMQQMVGQVGQQMGQQQQTPQQHLTQQQAQMGQQQINIQQQMANQQNQQQLQQLQAQQQQRWSSQLAAQQAMQQQQQQQQQQERMGLSAGGPTGQPGQPQMQPQPVNPQQIQTQRAPEIVRVLNQPPIAASQSPPTQSQLGQLGLPQLPSQQPNKERRNIWTGLLEWHEKLKGPPDGQKVPRQVPCQVSANVVNNQPEVNGDGWPAKLIMQLIPKAIVGNLGGSYFMDVKTVLFMLQQCDALASLTRVMESGFAGCVHFTGSGTGSCDIKVLILLYSKERCAYLGFIPNDQIGFVDRIRKVIQQQKTQQASLRQGQAGAFPPGAGGMPARMIGMGVGQQLLSQQLQQPPQQLQGQQMQPGQQMQVSQQQMQAAAGQQLQQQRQVGPGPGQIAAQLGQQQQQLQSMLSQQQSQGQGQGIPQQSQQSADVDPRELERQRNVMEIQQLQLQLQAARQRELELQQQQLQSGGQMTQGPGSQNPLQGQHSQQQLGMASMGQQQVPVGVGPSGQQQQQMGFPGLQQQQQARQQLLQQQQQQRGQRPTSMQQTNPGLKSLLQQQSVNVGPQFRAGAGGPMAARMAGMQGMHPQQQGQQPSQDQQQGQHMPPQPYDDVRILDLLR